MPEAGFRTAVESVAKRMVTEEAGSRTASIVACAEDAITSATLEGVITGWNPGAEKLYGCPADEAVGRTVWDVMKPLGGADEVTRNIVKVKRGEAVGPFDAVHHTREGRPLHASVVLSPIKDSTGRVSGIYAINRDVTERRRDEEALRRSEARLAETQQLAHLGSWEWDVRTGEVYWSDEMYRICGFAPREFVPTFDKFIEALHPDDKDLVRKTAEDILHSNKPYDLNHRIVRPDGEVRHVYCRAEIVLDEEGEPLRMFGTIHDITEGKQAEEKLEQLHRHNELILNSAGEGIYGLDLQGKTTFVNPAAVRLTGWDAEELIGRHQHEMIHHTKSDGTPYPNEECPIYAALNDGTIHRVTEEVFWRKDGTSFPVDYVSTPIRERGEIVGAVVLFEDITERKQAEEKRKESEKRFRSLIQNATDLITVLEEDGTISYESPTVERILGYLPEERIGKNAFDYLHPNDEDSSKAAFAEALDNPGQVQPPMGFRLRHKDGSWRHMETTRTNLLDDPAVKGVVANSRDITERRRAEEALRESEERYRAVMEQSAEAIWLFDPDTKQVLESNSAFQEMLGYTAEELRGLTNYDFVAHSREDIDSTVWRKVQEGNDPPTERKYRRADGTLLDVEVKGTLICYGGKEVVCSVARDLTKRREAEKALKESEASLAETQRMAHLGGWTWDVRTDEVYWSDEVFRIYGFTPGEFTPTLDKLMEIVHPDDRDRVKKSIEEAFYEDKPYDFEHRIVRPDGEERVVHRQAEVAFGEEGEPLRMIGTVHDITDRKKAEERLRESEERFRAVIEQAIDGVYLADVDTQRLLQTNAAFQEMLGYTAEELREMYIYDFIAHEPENVDAVFQDILEAGERFVGERRYRRKDGSMLDVEASATVISYGDRRAVCKVVRDVTDRKKAEEALRQSEERFRTVFEDAPIGVALVGIDGRRLRVNQALCEMLGYSEEELLGQDYLSIVHPDDREISSKRLDRTMEEESKSYTLERRYVHADGHKVWNLTSVSLIRDSEGNPSHLVCLHQDITDRKKLEEKLSYQALHDSLTGLPNRKLFMDHLEKALARLERREEPIAVLFVDLDNFKDVNDSLGHEAGDQVLVAIAERLRRCIRPEDTVARLAGDEFVVLLGGVADLGDATRAGERMTEALSAPFDIEGREVFVSASIGIATTTEASDKPKDLLRNADLALYEAKEQGKSQYVFFGGSMSSGEQD